MARISAVVIAKNEAHRIEDCLRSLVWADEIVVVDSYSVDGTDDVSRLYTDAVYQEPFVNFAVQRNRALKLASHNWIFFADADERVEQPLREELEELAPTLGSGGLAGYGVPRRNIIWGGWVRGGGWYPDYQLRLMDRRRAHYDEARPVHEVVVLDGHTGYLRHELLHLNYQTVGQFLVKQDRYSRLQAQTLRQGGAPPKARALLGQPLREFERRYRTMHGWRDGWRGLLLSALLAYYQGKAYWLARTARK